MSPVTGKPYRISPDWIVGLQAPKVAILVYAPLEWPGLFQVQDAHGNGVQFPTAEEAITKGPASRVGYASHMPYANLAEAALAPAQWDGGKGRPVYDYAVLIQVLGLVGAWYFTTTPEEEARYLAVAYRPTSLQAVKWSASINPSERDLAERLASLAPPKGRKRGR